jgi:hypothetical protein
VIVVDWAIPTIAEHVRSFAPSVIASQLGHANAYLTFTTYGRFVATDADFEAPAKRATGSGK